MYGVPPVLTMVPLWVGPRQDKRHPGQYHDRTEVDLTPYLQYHDKTGRYPLVGTLKLKRLPSRRPHTDVNERDRD